jgi:hypothetical protein
MTAARRTHPLAMLLVVAALSGCSDDLTAPDDEPYVVGEITRVRPGENGLVVLIEERPGVQTGTKIDLFLDDASVIVAVSADGRRHAGSPTDLAVGRTARGWAGPTIADSYPQQGSARFIEVLLGG